MNETTDRYRRFEKARRRREVEAQEALRREYEHKICPPLFEALEIGEGGR